MMGRIDRAIGKWLFVPLVIRVCQMLGCSQYRFHSYAWMILMVGMVARGPGHLGTAWFITFSIGAVFRVASAAIAPERQDTSAAWLRFVFMMAVGSNLVAAVCGKPPWLDMLFSLGALTAEYALTIKTIPPRETKQARSAASKQAA